MVPLCWKSKYNKIYKDLDKSLEGPTYLRKDNLEKLNRRESV